MQGHVLRRTKEEVLTVKPVLPAALSGKAAASGSLPDNQQAAKAGAARSLPDKHDITVWVRLAPEQLDLYHHISTVPEAAAKLLLSNGLLHFLHHLAALASHPALLAPAVRKAATKGHSAKTSD